MQQNELTLSCVRPTTGLNLIVQSESFVLAITVIVAERWGGAEEEEEADDEEKEGEEKSGVRFGGPPA